MSGRGAIPAQGSQTLWSCMTWELPGSGETPDTEQSIILRKLEVLVGQTKKVMKCTSPSLMEKVPRKTQRSPDGGFTSWNMSHACSIDQDPGCKYCSPIMAHK